MTLLDALPSLRGVGHPRLDPALWPATTRVDADGRVSVGGVALADVADRHGTPCVVLDEADVRGRCRTYRDTLPWAATTYAGGALLTRAVARWVTGEGLRLGVGSAAELATALAGGVDPEGLVLHGAALPPHELAAGLRAGVGALVLDSPTALVWAAAQAGRRQAVLLRLRTPVRPGDDPATAAAGAGLAPDQVGAAAARVLAHPHLELLGLHQHLGGRTTEPRRHAAVLRRLLTAAADVHDRTGAAVREVHLGGGQGVPTLDDPAALDLTALAEALARTRAEVCAARGLPEPLVVLEPGRGVVERAGVTLARVLAVRDEAGVRAVTVDGAAGPDPRTGLTTHHAVALVGRRPGGPTAPTTVLGRCRAPGDVVAGAAELPTDLHPGDLVAVAGTGAGTRSAAACSPAGRAPLVAVADGSAHLLLHGDAADGPLTRDAG